MSVDKKALISLLIRLSKSDQHVHAHEANFVKDVGARMGLELADILAIENDPDAYPLSPPQSEHERVSILYHILFMMKMDGVVSAEEEKLTHQIGLKLGFRPEMVQAMIQLIKENVKTDVPPDQMLAILKRYLN